MAMYEIRDGGLLELPPSDFAALGLRERQDLQAYIFRNIKVLGEDLKVVAQEYGSWEDARRRLDLLALDREGHLVVIELKRTSDGGHAELQALRYAAMISAMTFEDVVDAYSATLSTPLGQELIEAGVEAREDLISYLDIADGEPPTLSDVVRIIIVAADFGKELTTAVLWLNGFDRMDIRCIRLRPYDIDGRTLLDVEQVIPLKEAAEYQVRMRRKVAAVRDERAEGRDWTPYIITTGPESTEPLRKRWAVLRLVQAVHAAGVPALAIRPAITGPRFLAVDGELTGDELKAAFVAAHPKAADRLGRWFFTDPIIDNGRTWVLSNQWGGENATRTLDALVSLAPPSSGISYAPA
jgi:endonuclease NucS-like protein